MLPTEPCSATCVELSVCFGSFRKQKHVETKNTFGMKVNIHGPSWSQEQAAHYYVLYVISILMDRLIKS